MANEKKINYVLLGLLSHESLTGYEIKKRLDTRLRLFWNASYGSIYPTLNELEKDGLVKKEELEEKGRDKIRYTITEDGREVLKAWLEKTAVKDELRYETLLKLFFGSEIGEDITLEHIHRFGEKIEKELPFLKTSVSQLKEPDLEEEHKYIMLTALFGVKVYETYLEWCKEVEEVLKAGGKKDV